MSGLLDDLEDGVYADQVQVTDRASPLPPAIPLADDDEIIERVPLRLPRRVARDFVDGVCGGRKGRKDRITPSAMFEALFTTVKDNPKLMEEVVKEARKIDGYRKASACQKRLETQIAARDAG